MIVIIVFVAIIFVCIGEGVNELLFLMMKAGDSRTNKLSQATVQQLLYLQNKLRN